MNRITSCLVGIAALGVIATAADAADGCGRGMFYNGRRCVPMNEGPSVYIGRDRDDYRGRSYYREREYRRPGIGIDTPGFDIRVR
jgi:hypothetical protein